MSRWVYLWIIVRGLVLKLGKHVAGGLRLRKTWAWCTFLWELHPWDHLSQLCFTRRFSRRKCLFESSCLSIHIDVLTLVPRIVRIYEADPFKLSPDGTVNSLHFAWIIDYWLVVREPIKESVCGKGLIFILPSQSTNCHTFFISKKLLSAVPKYVSSCL